MSGTSMSVAQGEIVPVDDTFTLRLARKPDAVVAEARLVADSLIAAVKRNGWVQKYGAKEHLYFEAWAFLATMYRVTARIKETRLVQMGDVTGYEAYAEAFHIPSGIIIGTADAMCLDDEDNWDTRTEYKYIDNVKTAVGQKQVPLFQLRSMAQTRAMAKALKSPFSWIVAMAGYAPTPQEEMGKKNAPVTPAQQPQQRTQPVNTQQQPTGDQAQQQNGGARKITEPQRKRIYGISKFNNVSDDVVAEIYKGYGFAVSADITVDAYDAIVAAVEKAGHSG